MNKNNDQKPSFKLIIALREKKNRLEKGMFVVEGEKNVVELLKSNLEIIEIMGTKKSLFENESFIIKKRVRSFVLDNNELREFSSLEENQDMLVIAKIPCERENLPNNGIIIALDNIRDPGNLGSIMRIADWYGIKDIVASKETVDTWNAKTVNASMGSFTRVNVTHTNLFNFLENTELPILGAHTRGTNIHDFDFPESGVLLIGSESNGISKNIEHFIKNKITIPRYGKAESLNASVATAVILDKWKSK
jgi:TrmH family RNA methyltransferase